MSVESTPVSRYTACDGVMELAEGSCEKSGRQQQVAAVCRGCFQSLWSS